MPSGSPTPPPPSRPRPIGAAARLSRTKAGPRSCARSGEVSWLQLRPLAGALALPALAPVAAKAGSTPYFPESVEHPGAEKGGGAKRCKQPAVRSRRGAPYRSRPGPTMGHAGGTRRGRGPTPSEGTSEGVWSSVLQEVLRGWPRQWADRVLSALGRWAATAQGNMHALDVKGVCVSVPIFYTDGVIVVFRDPCSDRGAPSGPCPPRHGRATPC